MRRWRKSTWAIVFWTVLIGLWLYSYAGDVSSIAVANQYEEAGRNIGAGIGTTFIFGVWFLGFIVLSVIWFASRPHRRLCPACGNEVRKGLTKCANCGHDFAATGVAA